MNLRACFPHVTLTTLILLAPCLAGEFGQTRQHFAQYGIGGEAETAFDAYNPGEAAIVVEVELFNSDGDCRPERHAGRTCRWNSLPGLQRPGRGSPQWLGPTHLG